MHRLARNEKQKICAIKKGFQIYPPPTTPPEPAPPDHIGTSSMMRQYKSNLVSASQSSLDDITCKPNKKIHLIHQNCFFSFSKNKKNKICSLSLWLTYLFVLFGRVSAKNRKKNYNAHTQLVAEAWKIAQFSRWLSLYLVFSVMLCCFRWKKKSLAAAENKCVEVTCQFL